MKKQNYEYAGRLIKSIKNIDGEINGTFPNLLVEEDFNIINLNGAGIFLADSFACDIKDILNKYKAILEKKLEEL